MQMTKRLQCQRAGGGLRYLDEEELAQLGEKRRRKTQGSIGNDQREWNDQKSARCLDSRRQTIDDVFQQNRHRYGCQLRGNEAGEREQHPAFVSP